MKEGKDKEWLLDAPTIIFFSSGPGLLFYHNQPMVSLSNALFQHQPS